MENHDDGLSPAEYAVRRDRRIAILADRVGRDLAKPSFSGVPAKPHHTGGAHGTRVRCVETGVVFTSIRQAATWLKTADGSIRMAVRTGHPCKRLRFEYADGKRTTPPRVHERRGRPCPVVSDKGEWFPSAYAASLAMGLSTTAVAKALHTGCRIAMRHWRRVDEARTNTEVAA